MFEFFSFHRMLEFFPKIISCFPITLSIVVVGIVAGIFFGTVLAFIRIYHVPLLNQLAFLFISFIRGTPIIVQLFVVYYGLPVLFENITGINIDRIDKFYFVLVTYALNEAGFLAEIIRASILAVPIGQTEAGYAVGLSGFDTFRKIVMPQAARLALPAVGVDMINLFKSTSLAYLLGIMDIVGKVQAIGANTYHYLEGYACTAIIFVVINFVLGTTFKYVNKKLSYGA